MTGLQILAGIIPGITSHRVSFIRLMFPSAKSSFIISYISISYISISYIPAHFFFPPPPWVWEPISVCHPSVTLTNWTQHTFYSFPGDFPMIHLLHTAYVYILTDVFGSQHTYTKHSLFWAWPCKIQQY